jgi:hypothetical protein
VSPDPVISGHPVTMGWRRGPSVRRVTASSRAETSSGITGLLVIRVWLEPEHRVTLRARITRSVSADPEGLDPNEPIAKTITVATTEDALGAVRAWLDSFVGSDQPSVAQ